MVSCISTETPLFSDRNFSNNYVKKFPISWPYKYATFIFKKKSRGALSASRYFTKYHKLEVSPVSSTQHYLKQYSMFGVFDCIQAKYDVTLVLTPGLDVAQPRP